MKRDEANFRIEVWDREDGNLLETISYSSSFQISVAAWNAAQDHCKGKFLIHYNNRFVMERGLAGRAQRPKRMRPATTRRRPHHNRDFCFNSANWRNGTFLAANVPRADMPDLSIAGRLRGAWGAQ
ncbi:hypothetical protein [Rhizobium leguminosarum]|uniref:hypothetical protein n=1 Tax=Rhizobium leguminosarum TaxID=384 RepID=UPI00140FAC4E|nr:hypothetical protein [Rhizobium leguminosarum]QIO68164.1 hypothetical protein HA462_25045 [Rhizobium leguminosarum bv. trifolii]